MPRNSESAIIEKERKYYFRPMIWRGVYITFLHQQKIELVEKYKMWI